MSIDKHGKYIMILSKVEYWKLAKESSINTEIRCNELI